MNYSSYPTVAPPTRPAGGAPPAAFSLWAPGPPGQLTVGSKLIGTRIRTRGTNITVGAWSPRNNFAMSRVGQNLVIAGGSGKYPHTDCEACVSQVWRAGVPGRAWQLAYPKTPGVSYTWPARQGARSVTVNDTAIYLIGGKLNGELIGSRLTVTNEVWLSQDSGSTWALVGPRIGLLSFAGRYNFGAVAVRDPDSQTGGQKIVMMGGGTCRVTCGVHQGAPTLSLFYCCSY
jgi:hypothetical protein